MLKIVRKTIHEYRMIEEGDHILVAVSGGPDSMALLRALLLLSPEYRVRLTVAHLNHGLRGIEADEDEAFVRCFCMGAGIACLCQKTDVRALWARHGGSLEEVARQERYRFLREAADSCGANKIATGHHLDDQAETVLINLLRGSGLEGLKGIAPVRNDLVIRPLLEVARSEIMNFLGKEGLSYTTDSSNMTPLFLRNRIRKDLIPSLIKNFNPQIVKGLSHMANILRRDDQYLQEEVQKTLLKWGILNEVEERTLPLRAFQDLHIALQGRMIKVLLEGFTKHGYGIAYCHIHAVLDLARNPRSYASLDLPQGIRIEKKEGTLLMRRQSGGMGRQLKMEHKIPNPQIEVMVEVPGRVTLGEYGKTFHFQWIDKPGLVEMKKRPQIAFMDYDRIVLPLVLRGIRPGDRMIFMGMKGNKKLQEYFIDEKVCRSKRSQIPLLADKQGVIWLAGERISERVRITDLTKKVLKAEMI